MTANGSDKPNISPALKLLGHVWEHSGKTSWRVINESMQVAMELAITSGFKFDVDDLDAVKNRFRPEYWMDSEGCYTLACAGPHGPNPSAIQAIEHCLGRKPFICPETAGNKRLVRLHRGLRFAWHKDLARPVQVKVTSFSAIKGVPCAIACGYLKTEEGKTSKVTRQPAAIFRITHADITAYRAAIAAWQAQPQPLPEKPEGLAGMSPWQRAAFLRGVIDEKRKEAVGANS